MSTKPIIPIPPNPTRADLRAARQSLTMLATAGVKGAKEELAALDVVIRRLYPKVARGSNPGGGAGGGATVVAGAQYDQDGVLTKDAETRKRGRRRKRRIIDASVDCLGTCPDCNGSGSRKVKQIGPAAPAPGAVTAGILGKAERIAPRGLPKGRMVRVTGFRLRWRSWVMRTPAPLGRSAAGTVAAWTPAVVAKRAVTVTSLPCSRCLGTGRVPVAVSERPKHENFRGLGRPMRGDAVKPMAVSAYRPMPPRGHATYNTNVPAEVRAMGRLSAMSDGSEAPRGRRLMGSRREAPLTPNQSKRAPVARRLARYQAEADRAAGRGRVRLGKSQGGYDSAAFEDALRALGLNEDQVKAAALLSQTQVEDDGIAEARRRGDLPPDDLLEPVPGIWRVTTPDGTGALDSQRLHPALVCRARGGVERVERPMVVRLDDGSVGVFAAEDVAVM